MIEAFFFGAEGREVFGTYHPPTGGGVNHLTIICPPLFAEYMSTHLALRELAISLSTAGQHVIRFDYRGTGDSSGEISEMRLQDWIEDIRSTIREGIDISGASQLNLVGVRAGALLLCKALQRGDRVHRIALWDPVPDGRSYVETLRDVQRSLLARNPFLRRGEKTSAATELAGQPVADAMIDDLTTLESAVYNDIDDVAEVVFTKEDAEMPPKPTRRSLVRFPCNWGTDSEALLMPKPVLERLRAIVVGR